MILLVVLLRLKQPSEVFALFLQANGWLIAASLAINVLAIHIKVVRWQVLLRARGIVYGTKKAWVAFCSSLYLGMLTPGRVGDVLRIQYLRHDEGSPYSEGLASVVMDRMCDLYVLAGFVAIAIARYGSVLAGELWWASWLVVVATVLGPLVLLVPKLPEKLFGAMYRKISKDPEAKSLTVFLTALRAQVGKPLLATVPITIFAFLVSFAQSWVIARAMGIDLSYFDVLCLTAIASLLSLLPISVAGVGVREALFAAIFPFLGYSKEQGVGFGMLVFAIVYLAAAGVGFVTWQVRPPPAAALEGVRS